MAFPIEIDAHQLSYLSFRIPDVTPDWMDIRTIRKWDMSEGRYTLTCGSGHPLGFTVTANGTVEYDAIHDPYVAGRGTDRLEIVGYAVTVDATRPSHPQFFIPGVTNQWTDAQAPQTFQLLPGTYYLHHASGQATAFLVTAQGTIDYDPALDVPPGSTQGVFRGRGSATLELVGYTVTVDATRPSHPQFFIPGVTNQWTDAQAPQTFQLLPGTYYLHHASGQATAFLVTAQGTIDYDPALDVPPGSTQGVFRGRGSATLELVGYTVTVDATRPSHPQFFIPGVTNQWTDAQAPHAFQLLPGTYYLHHASGQATAFLVTAQGTIDYDPALDVPPGSTQGVFRGHGSTTLELVGYTVTVDATRPSHPQFFIPGVTNQWTTTQTIVTFRLLPGAYTFQVAGATYAFTVTQQGTIDYDATWDIHNPDIPGFLSGRGTVMIIFVGYNIQLDATALTIDKFHLVSLNDWFNARQVQGVHLLPAGYSLEFVAGMIDRIQFEVTFGGTLSYAPEYDVTNGGMLQGEGEKTLKIHGYSLLVDASALQGVAVMLMPFNIVIDTTASAQVPQTIPMIPYRDLALELHGTPPQSAIFDMERNGTITLLEPYPFAALEQREGHPLIRLTTKVLREKRACRPPVVAQVVG